MGKAFREIRETLSDVSTSRIKVNISMKVVPFDSGYIHVMDGSDVLGSATVRDTLASTITVEFEVAVG
jgi:hypothetical protein